MKKKIIIILAVSAIIAIFSTISLFVKPILSPAQLEECKTLKQEGDISILIFSDQETAKKYSNYFLNQEPFNQYQDKFSFYYIDTYEPECGLYQEKAILCYNKELIKKSSSCPNDYIIVIKEKPPYIRSSSYMNILSINKNHPKSVLKHEFGHAFISLADEYVPSKIPWGSENCAKDCEEFAAGKCYKGCSEKDYYRSIENGVMRTLSSENYGEYNTELIENKLKFSGKGFLTGLAIESKNCQEEYYLIEAEYKEEIKIINKTIEKGCINQEGDGIFSYKLYSKEKLLEKEFNPVLVFTDSEEKGEVLERRGKFYLKIPVIEEANKLEILKQDKKIKEINLKIDNMPCKIK